MGRKNAGIKTVCENRKARHDYFIHETYEAGIALQGTEVKSLRAGRANLKDSYASIQNGEIFVENLHISPYDQGNIFNHDPLRRRKLLMHKAEIVRSRSTSSREGPRWRLHWPPASTTTISARTFTRRPPSARLSARSRIASATEKTPVTPHERGWQEFFAWNANYLSEKIWTIQS